MLLYVMLKVSMSKLLSELLSANEPLFSVGLQQLERASSYPSVDVRLSAEIIGKVHQKKSHLGLDPRDTTGPELYHALLELTKLHDGFLAKRLGAKDPADVADILPRLVKLIYNLDIPKTAWVIKDSTAKRLLKATPPRKAMKYLGYRSIDSMLKREPIHELYGALRFVETPEWQAAFVRKYKRLTPSDFETRPIDIIQLDNKKWGTAASVYVQRQHHNLTHLKELGVILLLPLPVRHLPGASITMLPLLLHYITEIRMYSAFFRLQQVRPDFGDIVTDTLLHDPGKHANIAGHHVHWRIIHRYFGTNTTHHPELFEPHVQPEDLAWRKAEDVLYRIEPALHFWHDMDFVGQRGQPLPVSFNLIDMAVSYVNNLPYGQHAVYHMRDALWNEVYVRYMGQRSLEHQVLAQLNRDVIEPEFAGMFSDIAPERSFLV
jgi:hypothetical protein